MTCKLPGNEQAHLGGRGGPGEQFWVCFHRSLCLKKVGGLMAHFSKFLERARRGQVVLTQTNVTHRSTVPQRGRLRHESLTHLERQIQQRERERERRTGISTLIPQTFPTINGRSSSRCSRLRLRIVFTDRRGTRGLRNVYSLRLFL